MFLNVEPTMRDDDKQETIKAIKEAIYYATGTYAAGLLMDLKEILEKVRRGYYDAEDDN